MTTTELSAPKAGRRSLGASGGATVRCINRLQYAYRNDNPAAVAVLARLRREAGRAVHDSPDSWGIDGLEDLVTVRSEESGRGRDEDRDLREEEAVHLAVTLWALHQQSVYDDNMHKPGRGLGRAVRRLAAAKGSPDSAGSESQKEPRSGRDNEELNESLRKRFVRIGTSTSYEVLALRLREMVLLLRGARVSLDYGLLADQLFLWQDESKRSTVRRSWGRDFHSTRVSADSPSDSSGEENGARSDDSDSGE
ncbi:type I-E CRISPR-associated protein Cse2/CasB [Streptomyces sp. NPDC006798]|uniref:type I-E CRISPR-associated protein Cse2/CasB n=1 Tax=Streptomyces sp. NPDC006798 TaxID=3155462 RepID=UPI0033F02586